MMSYENFFAEPPMIKKCRLSWFAAGALLLVGGCGVSTPERYAVPVMVPELMASEEVQSARAKEFRELISKVKIRGIGIYPKAYHIVPPEELLDRMEALGFNRVYCYISSEKQLDDTFRDFIARATKRRIAVEAVLDQRDFYSRSTGNKIIRFFRPSYLRLDEAAEGLAEFNAELPPGSRLAGLTVISEPHLFTPTNPDTPPDSLYYWSEETYGPDLDNAMLMKQSLDMLKAAAQKAHGLPVTAGVADFYHELVIAGKLPLGKVSDFCAVSPRIILLDSGNKPSQAADVVENELTEIPENCSALICINLAGHTSVDSGALRRRDWNDLMRGMRYLLGRFQEHRTFEGFVIAPFSAFAFIHAEHD